MMMRRFLQISCFTRIKYVMLLVLSLQHCCHGSRPVLAGASLGYFPTSRSRRARITSAQYGRRWPSSSRDSVLLASSRMSKGRKAKEDDVVSNNQVENAALASSQQQQPKITYADLGILGKLVAGSVEVTLTTVMEYITGFCGGYFLGTVTDVPRLFFRPMEPSSSSSWREVSGRFGRLHTKSFRWATSWGGISAAFGCFRVMAKVVRNGREDEWSNVLSSMAAGAYFARSEGPQAMVRGAVLYGGLVYLLSGGLRTTREPFEFQEEPLSF